MIKIVGPTTRPKLKITVKNKTAWQTKMLLPFIRRIANEEFPGTTHKNTRRRLYIDIVYTRTVRGCSGYAYYNSSQSTVRVPHPKHGVFPVLDFCHVVGHEFGHNKGLKHADMGLHYGHSCHRGSYSGPHYDWAKALPVPLPKAKPRAPSTSERRAKELKTARAAVLNWQRKSKLAATKVKLWTRRVKTLEKRITLDRSATAAVSSAGTFDAAPPSQLAGELSA